MKVCFQLQDAYAALRVAKSSMGIRRSPRGDVPAAEAPKNVFCILPCLHRGIYSVSLCTPKLFGSAVATVNIWYGVIRPSKTFDSQIKQVRSFNPCCFRCNIHMVHPLVRKLVFFNLCEDAQPLSYFLQVDILQMKEVRGS